MLLSVSSGRVKVEEEVLGMEDVLEYMAREIAKQSDDMAAITDDPVVMEISEFTRTMFINTVEGPDMMRALLKQMNKATVMKALAALDGKNGEVKIETMKKLIYKNQLSMISRKEDQMKSMKDLMTDITKYMIISCYAGEDGLIAWTGMKKDAMEANTEIDKAAGRAEAEAGPVVDPALRGILGRVFG